MPSRVPVRVAKNSSVPECGEPRSGPEWTRLEEKKEKDDIFMRGGALKLQSAHITVVSYKSPAMTL